MKKLILVSLIFFILFSCETAYYDPNAYAGQNSTFEVQNRSTIEDTVRSIIGDSLFLRYIDLMSEKSFVVLSIENGSITKNQWLNLMDYIIEGNNSIDLDIKQYIGDYDADFISYIQDVRSTLCEIESKYLNNLGQEKIKKYLEYAVEEYFIDPEISNIDPCAACRDQYIRCCRDKREQNAFNGVVFLAGACLSGNPLVILIGGVGSIIVAGVGYSHAKEECKFEWEKCVSNIPCGCKM